MHVKYASRHMLYSVPNEFDCVVDIDMVARAGRVCVLVFCVLRAGRIGVWAVRVAVVFVARAFVAVRAVERGVDALREMMLAPDVRAVVLDDGREGADDALFVSVRDMVFASRTAALAMPILTKIAVIKYNAFLIRSTISIMISKNLVSNKKNERKKRPIGRFF